MRPGDPWKIDFANDESGEFNSLSFIPGEVNFPTNGSHAAYVRTNSIHTNDSRESLFQETTVAGAPISVVALCSSIVWFAALCFYMTEKF